MSANQTFQTTVTAELAALRAENSEMKIMLKELLAQPQSQTKTKTKTKAKKEVEGEAKEKKAPNEWIVFSGRVEKLVRAQEEAEGATKETKMKTVVVKQFSSHLKSKKVYAEWADDEIVAELATWEPPTVSKQELAGKSKKTPPASAAASDSEEAPKKRKPQSEETKKNAAIKRAATKAANAAKAKTTSAEASEAEEETFVAETVVKPAAPKPAAPAAPKPAKPAAKVAPKPKKVDLLLDSWTHDGTDYLKNERNDVVSVDGEWVGRWTGSAIDTAVPEPADFEKLTTRE